MRPVINIASWISKLEYSKTWSGFKDGQVFAGKILKSFPNQMAEVLVNGTKLIAKMEIPIEANVRYLFHVHHSESGLIQLKVLPSTSGSSNLDLPNQLLNLFQVKSTRLAATLAETVIANPMPITKKWFFSSFELAKYHRGLIKRNVSR